MSERALSEGMREAVTQPVVRPVLFYLADFPEGIIRLWTGLQPLEWDGEIWQGIGSFLALEDITETTDTAQKGLAVVLSGVPSETFNAVQLANYQGRRAAVWLGAFDGNGELVLEPYKLFEGVMDSDSVEDNGSEVKITMFAESRLSDHLRARVFRYSHEDQQTLYPEADDYGFEYVAALQDAQLIWGRR